MAQDFLTIRAVARPFTLQGGGTTAATVVVDSAVVPVWRDGTVDPTWTPPMLATSLYGGVTIDTTALNWLLLALKGTTPPVLLKEADLATADTILTGAGHAGATWGLLARVDGVAIDKIPQV